MTADRSGLLHPEPIIRKILDLKKQRNAVIVAHNYQRGEVQDIADFVGDSLELSRKAGELEADIIVFCGVHFMAETAAVLAPEKDILLPAADAGCPMADMITAGDLREWKERYPGREVVCYVNTSAEVKAESDICCTSSNAVEVVNSLAGDEILFVPDKNLAAFISRWTKKKIIPWDGYCYVHHFIRDRDIEEKKKKYPEAEVWAHPECRPEVVDLADKVISTGKMVKEARTTTKKEVILATEPGIIHRLGRENPAVDFYPAKDAAFYSNMKKTDLLKVLRALEQNIHKIVVPRDIADKSRSAIEKMLRIQ